MSTPGRAVSLIVTGSVQGVSYRATCADKARELDLTGWVRNEPDGSVSVFAQGDPDDVETLVDWCHEGPEAASVADVEVLDVAPQSFATFDVVR